MGMIKILALLSIIGLIMCVAHFVVNQNTHDDRKDDHGF